ncbi:MAG: Flp pilus assembly complex ATPase component TadA [Candidatus Sericytochromatia bacterium]|nr:Flp pilus assembly complex ATPase component TadA [Candidatus Sericytochromatia bacterium]
MSQSQTLKMGEILIREGYLTMDACQKVLQIQKEQGYISKSRKAYKPFGQICVELKLLSADELQRVLQKHQKRIRLGELLLNQGLIQAKQLEKALERQADSGKKLGQLLLEANAINPNQLMDALALQLDLPRMTPDLDLIDTSLLTAFALDFYREAGCLPLYCHNDELTVVMADPLNQELIKQLQRQYRARICPALAPPAQIQATLDAFAARQAGQPAVTEPVSDAPQAIAIGAESLTPPPESPAEQAQSTATAEVAERPQPTAPASASPTVSDQALQVVDFLIKNALKERANAIHIEPQQKHLRVRYRIDGVLHHKTDLPSHLAERLSVGLKSICGLDPSPSRRQQRARCQHLFQGQPLQLQLATYPSAWGESLVLEAAAENEQQDHLLNLERIGFSPLNLLRYRHLLSEPGGLMILTGPARTGKSTTLYASVHDLNQRQRAIMTAEDSIERPVPGAIQAAYQAERDGHFADLIRAMAYLDPDVLMVSEIQNSESLEAITELASGGAKVLTAYPAFDATGAMLRLNRMGLNHYLIASSQLTVLSQRLVRKLCPHCRQPESPDPHLLRQLGLVDVDPSVHTYFRPVGCSQCQMHGFMGQTAIHELLHINEAIREAILAQHPAATIRGIARTEAKLVSMAEDGLYKAITGVTSLAEVQRVAFVNEYDLQTPWEAEEIEAICKGEVAEFI